MFLKITRGGRALAPAGNKNLIYGGAVDGELPSDLVTKRQLDAVQSGSVDLARIEFSADGTASAPVLTWNGDTNTGIYRIGADNIGITAGGTKIVDIATTGITVTGAILATTTVASTTTLAAGTSFDVGTNQTFAKEVNHTVTVTATTTAATAGGNLSIASGAGATSGAGGTASLTSGAGGATGDGGVVSVVSGAGGGTSGASGNANITTGSATVGGTGDINLTTGNTASGLAGDIILTTGTHTSTTVSPIISLNKAVVRKPNSATVASGGTITGPELVGGLIAATGATGNWQLPTAAQITTAIGATPAGTYFDFVFNAAAMTATNTATLVVGANMSVMSAPAITGGATLTVTQDTQVVGHFRITYDTATTCKISRIA